MFIACVTMKGVIKVDYSATCTVTLSFNWLAVPSNTYHFKSSANSWLKGFFVKQKPLLNSTSLEGRKESSESELKSDHNSINN